MQNGGYFSDMLSIDLGAMAKKFYKDKRCADWDFVVPSIDFSRGLMI